MLIVFKALFDKMNNGGNEVNESVAAKPKKKAGDCLKENENMDEYYVPDAAGEGKGSNKRLSIERIYQKKTQLEHILLRPDTYIGSIESVTQVKYCIKELLIRYISE